MDLIHAVWRRLLTLAFATDAIGGVSVAAQGAAPVAAPGPASQPAIATLPTYRPPALALVQPAAGASVPQDRPVVVFRFAPGELNDAVDSKSFAVTVDGQTRTALFQVAAGEAWGPLARSEDGAQPISVGAHRVAARICSSRGACTEAVETVIVTGSPAVPAIPVQAERKPSILDVILAAARKLLQP